MALVSETQNTVSDSYLYYTGVRVTNSSLRATHLLIYTVYSLVGSFASFK